MEFVGGKFGSGRRIDEIATGSAEFSGPELLSHYDRLLDLLRTRYGDPIPELRGIDHIPDFCAARLNPNGRSDSCLVGIVDREGEAGYMVRWITRTKLITLGLGSGRVLLIYSPLDEYISPPEPPRPISL